jgi:hypothetical protein
MHADQERSERRVAALTFDKNSQACCHDGMEPEMGNLLRSPGSRRFEAAAMTFAQFSLIAESHPGGVVLLEGRRSIPPGEAEVARRLASALARHFPKLRFRSGNASGTDQAFADGIAEVDAGRLQVVAPYSSHRQGLRYEQALYDSPSSLSQLQEETIAYKTTAATPANKRLIDNRMRAGPLAAKAAYLIRDTMKVTGYSEEFPKPICGLFFVDLDDPMAGGTGHTIRVCQQEGVPVVLQNAWQQWRIP